MPQTFIFVRHGSIPIKADGTTRLPKLATRGLSEAGIQEARGASAFVHQQLAGRSVDRLLLARSERARQTAAIIFDPLPEALTLPMSPRDPLPQVEAWLDGLGEDAVVVRVGHGPAFLATLSALTTEPPDLSLVFGAVLVAAPEDGWRITGLYAD